MQSIDTQSIILFQTGFRSTPSPSPYATALLPIGQPNSNNNSNSDNNNSESMYAKPESVCPSYYASSQLTQVNINMPFVGQDM